MALNHSVSFINKKQQQMSWHYNNKRQQKQVHKENTTNIFAKTQSNTCLVALPFKTIAKTTFVPKP